jgi:membrane associated rhomboid family serine protease
MNILNDIKQSYREGGVLTKFIYINVGVFVILRLAQIFFSFSQGPGASYPLLSWVSVPANPLELIFKPWTLFTYMFVHYEFFHFIFNILVLYWFGKLFLYFFNPRQFMGVYFLGGLSGAVVYFISYNTVPVLYSYFPSSILMGASASIMALLFTVARYRPDFTVHMLFFGPVKLKYIALIYVLIDLISISSLNNAGGSLAHLGGAAFGFIYGGSLMKGKDITLGFNRFMDRLVGLFKTSPKMKVTYKRPVSDMDYNAHKVKKQAELDRILEKIKTSGYDSLNKEEKKTLFDASKES